MSSNLDASAPSRFMFPHLWRYLYHLTDCRPTKEYATHEPTEMSEQMNDSLHCEWTVSQLLVSRWGISFRVLGIRKALF